MPSREGFYSGGRAQSGAHGLFSALGDVFSTLQGEQTKDRASKRELQREEDYKNYNEALAGVKSGDLMPGEAAAQTGLSPDAFSRFAPSPETVMGKLNSVLKPGTSDEEANVQMHALAPFRNVPDVANPSPFSEPGSLEYESPIQAQVSKLLQAKRDGADADAPVTKIGETSAVDPGFGAQATDAESGAAPDMPLGGDVTPQAIYGRYDRTHGGMQEVGRVASGPSARTAGLADSIKAMAEAPGKVSAANTLEAGTRGQKIATAQGLQQSNIDTSTSPANIRKEANKSSAIEFANTRAQDEARQAGIDPNVAKSYIHGTATGKNYLYFPPATDKEVIKKTVNQIASNPALQGSRVVNAQQASALENIQSARGDYDQFVQLVMKHVAKDFGGNILAAPRNYLANLVASDPEIRTAVTATFPEQIKGLRAIAGAFGRITQQEITKATGAFPSVTEPLSVLVQKRALYFDSLERTENSILDNK